LLGAKYLLVSVMIAWISYGKAKSLIVTFNLLNSFVASYTVTILVVSEKMHT